MAGGWKSEIRRQRGERDSRCSPQRQPTDEPEKTGNQKRDGRKLHLHLLLEDIHRHLFQDALSKVDAQQRDHERHFGLVVAPRTYAHHHPCDLVVQLPRIVTQVISPIGTKRTCPARHIMSVLGGKADIKDAVSDFRS